VRNTRSSCAYRVGDSADVVADSDSCARAMRDARARREMATRRANSAAARFRAAEA
jgi:hypothetical protein